jgi:hypothetical protein
MKKQSRLTGLVATLLGSMVLLNNLDKPRVTALHATDVLGLVAAGAPLGTRPCTQTCRSPPDSPVSG